VCWLVMYRSDPAGGRGDVWSWRHQSSVQRRIGPDENDTSAWSSVRPTERRRRLPRLGLLDGRRRRHADRHGRHVFRYHRILCSQEALMRPSLTVESEEDLTLTASAERTLVCVCITCMCVGGATIVYN